MEGKCLGDIQHFLLDSERINWDYMHASARAGFIRGGEQTGQLPRGLHQKHYKNYYLRKHKILFETIVPAMKPEATAIGNRARWPVENNLNVCWAQILRTEI